MALIDKLANDENGNIMLAHHTFSAAGFLWATGKITRQNVIDGLGLEVSDEAQLDQLAAHYQGLSAEEKREFHGLLESVGDFLQLGLITKAQAKTLLGMT